MPLNGYARVPRALLESDWSDEPETFLVLLRLIIGANFKETDWRGVHLMPGEIIISLSSLSSQSGLSVRKIRTAINRLKTTGYLTCEATSRYTRIFLTDKAFFRECSGESDTLNDTPIDNQTTCERQQRKKDKKDKTVDSSRKRFTAPSVDEVAAYCRERGNAVDAQRFVDFYASKGWKVGNAGMKDWRAAVRNWERQDNAKNGGGKNGENYDGIACV